MTLFSTFTLEALVQVVSGGPEFVDTEPPIGIYRSGPEIDRFMQAAKSSHAVPMTRLARYYREGYGFRVDHNMAVHLDIMAYTIEVTARKSVR